jgi:ribosomal protein L24
VMDRDLRSQFPHRINPLGKTAQRVTHRYNSHQRSPGESSNEVQYDFSDTEDGDENEEYIKEKENSQFDTNEVKVLPPGNLQWGKEDDNTLDTESSWSQKRRQAKDDPIDTFARRDDSRKVFHNPEERKYLLSENHKYEVQTPKFRVPEKITIFPNKNSMDYSDNKVPDSSFVQCESHSSERERMLRRHEENEFYMEKNSRLNLWPKFYFGSGTPGSSVIDFHIIVLTEQTFQHSSLVTSIMMDDHVYTPQQIKNQEDLQYVHYCNLELIARGFASMVQNRDRRSFVMVEFLDYDEMEITGPFLLVIGVLDTDDRNFQKRISIGSVVTIVRGTFKGSKGIVKDIADSKVFLIMTENLKSVSRWIPQKNVEVMDDLKILQHIESSVSTVEVAHCKPQIGSIHTSCQQQQVKKNCHQGLAAYGPDTGEDSNSYILPHNHYVLDDGYKATFPNSYLGTKATLLGKLQGEDVCIPDEKGTSGALGMQIQDQTTDMESTNNYQVITNPVAASTLEINGVHDSGSMKTANNESHCIVSINQTESKDNREKGYNEGKHKFLVDKSDEYSIHTRQVTQFPDATECNMLPVNVCEEKDSSKFERELPPSKRKPVAAIALTKRRFGDLQNKVDFQSQSILTMSKFDMPPKTLFKVFVNINHHSDKGHRSYLSRNKSTSTESEFIAAFLTYNKAVGEKQIDDSRSAWKFIESMSAMELKNKLKCMKLPTNGSKKQLFEKLVTALMVNANTPIDELPDMITKFNL